MSEYNYENPVSQLLTQGDCRSNSSKWPNYLELGFSSEHIPELIRMLSDEDLLNADSESEEVWSTIHAWRVLGQLQAFEAVKPLLEQVYRIDDEDDDWVSEEYPKVFVLIGPQAIPELSSYLSTGYGLYARICVANGITNIGNEHPESREICVEILTKQLAEYFHNNEALNGFLISYLVKLEAVGSIDVIREAFQNECVEYNIIGDIEEVEIRLGLRVNRSTPSPMFGWTSANDPQDTNSTFVLPESKVGRNDPCPCGSGKKYKKCCLRKNAERST